MKALLSALAVILISVAGARAQEGQPPECRLLPEHKASADAAYQPGVDVHGKAVVPADVNAAPLGLDGQNIIIPLSVDMAKRVKTPKGVNLESTLGFLEVSPDGRVTYNGQDLTAQAYAICGKNVPPLVPKPETPPVLPGPAPGMVIEQQPPRPVTPPVLLPAPNGQAGADALEYPPVKTPAPYVPQKPAVQGELLTGEEYQE